MNPRYPDLCDRLASQPASWLVTGAGGFIGSHLVQRLLELGQKVTGFDDFSSGYRHNLDQVRSLVGDAAWRRFELVEGDIRDAILVRRSVSGNDYVLHQAALGSVPRSLSEPVLCHDINATGFLHVCQAAREAGVKALVYASSSAVYGDHSAPVLREEERGNLLSPYAASKYLNEVYAATFARCYGLSSAGLRYFNVFGPRQDPQGAYAAVIPKWIQAMILEQPVLIHGDGETTRDFCHVTNVVQANLLAATLPFPTPSSLVLNVGANQRTTLNELFRLLRDRLAPFYPRLKKLEPTYGPFRAGDVRHSRADIARAAEILGYVPSLDLDAGLAESLAWYRQNLSR